MKKKVLALFMAAVMSLTVFTACGSKEKEEAPEQKQEETQKEGEYQFVSAEDTLKAEGVHVLDVREWANYAAGRVANSEWCPIFPLEDDALADAMKEYASANLSDGKEIYIICNSGNKGAQKATGVLKEAGIDEKLIFTVEGGAKALAEVDGALTTNRVDENIEWKYAKAADVLAETDAQVVDVRDVDTYNAGHLKDSYNVGLKEIESAEAQTELYELATEKLDVAKPVYLLCYSGNKCAKTAISVLKDAGFDTDNLFIIENGAKDADIQEAFVQ